jgi:TRAP-type C4-dicarboxylate transport system substrate-binding protein
MLERVGRGSIAASLVGVAGCTGGGDDGSVTLRWGSGATKNGQCWDCVHPLHLWRTKERLESETTGLGVRHIGGGQICSEVSCPGKVRQGVVQAGVASVSNSTGEFPENDIFQIPYLVRPESARTQWDLQATATQMTVGTQEVWQRYWVPFARKYGVVPISAHFPNLRGLFMGREFDDDVRVPEDLSATNAKMRRTKSKLAGHALEHWGAIPQDVAWGDTLQGMKSGVVDGLETWVTIGFAVGLGEVSSQVVMNYWQNGIDVDWANVEWLKGLSEEHREALAETTKRHTEEVAMLTPDVIENRAGLTRDRDAPEGSWAAKTDTRVQVLDEDEMARWREGLDVRDDPEQYATTIEAADEMTETDTLGEVVLPAADDPVTPEEVEVEMWWDDILDRV